MIKSAGIAPSIIAFMFVSMLYTANGQKFCEFTVYFETGSYAISKKEQQRIDSVLNKYDLNYRVNATFTGHTDTRGSKTYNQKLSQNRANAIKNYIDKKAKCTVLKNEGKDFSETVYKGDDEEQFGKNRRVNVELFYPVPEISRIGNEKLENEKFEMDVSSPSDFTAQSGTVLHVPANAFVDKDGNPVKGNVTLNYIEYRDPIDFILGGITMAHTENHTDYVFNSSGMFKLTGEQNGNDIFIAKNKEIKIDFVPTQNVDGTNYYNFDTAKQTWSNILPLTNNENKNSDLVNRVNAMNAHALMDREVNSCYMQPCEGMKYVGKCGVYYTENNIQLSEKALATAIKGNRSGSNGRSYMEEKINRYYKVASQRKQLRQDVDSLRSEIDRLQNVKDSKVKKKGE